MNQNQGHLERLDLQTGVYSLEYALDRLQQLASSPEADTERANMSMLKSSTAPARPLSVN